MKLFVIGTFLMLTSCSRNPYRVISVDPGDLPAKKINEKFIFLDKAYFEKDVDVSRLVTVLNKKSLDFNLKYFALSGRENTFLKAVDHMRKSQYDQAIALLQTLRNEDFDCQAGLLKIDCRNELNKASPTLDEYQGIYDCSSNPQVKIIVKRRFSLYKYGL